MPLILTMCNFNTPLKLVAYIISIHHWCQPYHGLTDGAHKSLDCYDSTKRWHYLRFDLKLSQDHVSRPLNFHNLGMRVERLCNGQDR